MKMPEVSDEQRALIKAAQQAIKVHTYNQLPKKLNRLAKAVKKTPMRIDIMLDKLMEILEDFPLHGTVDEDLAGALLFPTAIQHEVPDIIISESFL